MYPPWIERAVHQANCPKCQFRLGCEHVVSVSSLLVPSTGAKRDGPLCSVGVKCPRCGDFTQRMGATDRRGMLQAVEALFLRRRMPSPFDEVIPTEGPSPWQSKPGGVSPSNQNCPLTEIPERDVQKFLRMLDRTSFRRSSTSWHKLMRQFGCDL